MRKNKLCYGNQNNVSTISGIDIDREIVKMKYDWTIQLQCSMCNPIFYSFMRCRANRIRKSIIHKVNTIKT